MTDTPEPTTGARLRAIYEQQRDIRKELATTVQLTLANGPTEAAAGPDWQPMPGLNGLETRLIPGAFVLDTRGEAGTRCDEVAVPEGVDLYVKRGRMQVRRLDSEPTYTEYREGEVVYLRPGERHAWVLLEQSENRAVFVPASHYTLP